MTLLSSLLMAITFPIAALSAKPPSTVKELDLNKYQGLWYEVARLPNSFQDQCVGNVTAEYSLMKSGKIKVVNRCQEISGEIEVAEGRGRLSGKKSKSKLDVTFAKILGKYIFAFGGNYWVMELDKNYQWSLVGSPDRKFAWILARKPELSSDEMEKLAGLLEKQGYNPCDLLTTPQEKGRGISRSICETF
jgi:apolipoprotein D and lipocalin family protein